MDTNVNLIKLAHNHYKTANEIDDYKLKYHHYIEASKLYLQSKSKISNIYLQKSLIYLSNACLSHANIYGSCTLDLTYHKKNNIIIQQNDHELLYSNRILLLAHENHKENIMNVSTII